MTDVLPKWWQSEDAIKYNNADYVTRLRQNMKVTVKRRQIADLKASEELPTPEDLMIAEATRREVAGENCVTSYNKL